MELLKCLKKADLDWAARVKEFVSFAKAGYEETIGKEIAQYEKEKITIAVIGLMKRGKSTFCNAFLNRNDDELAPIGRLPATGIISKYCSHPTRREAEVRFTDNHTETIHYSDIRQYVTEEFNPENKKKVELVTIYGDFGFDEDVELMDMPGDNSIHAYHTEIVYRYLPQADVIIFLSSAQDPIQADELSLLKKVNKDQNNIFFVINKVDKCDEDELEDAEAQDRKVLGNAQINVRKLYRISAKEALEGKVSADYEELLEDIRGFLAANKVDLLRGVFVKRVLEAAVPALNVLETGTELKKLELSDLNKAMEELNRTAAAMKEQAAQVTASFKDHWKQMVDQFVNTLPEVEQKVQVRVAEHIKNMSMLSMGNKILDKLPEMINGIIEDELTKPTQAFEQLVRDEVARVNHEFPSISKYLSDENYRVTLQKQLGYGVGSTVFGGMLITGNLVISGAITGILSTTSTLTIAGIAVGKGVAAVLGVLATPLTALATIGMAGGALFMALPLYGWIRGKKQQKREVLDSAKASIENAFRTMRLQKLPELSRKGDDFIQEMNAQFEKELAAVEAQLSEAMEKKRNLDNVIDTDAFKKDEARLVALRELLEQGNGVLSSLNRNHEELSAK